MSKTQKISPEEFNQIISLAGLSLSKEEKQKIRSQLTEALDAVKVLSELDTKDLKPLSHPTNLQNITRKDKVTPSLTQEEALSQAKKTHNGYFVTKPILKHK